jgi:hypothetical protein
MTVQGVDSCPLIAAERTSRGKVGADMGNGDQWPNPYLTEWIDRATYRYGPFVLLTATTQRYLPQFDIQRGGNNAKPFLRTVYFDDNITVTNHFKLRIKDTYNFY